MKIIASDFDGTVNYHGISERDREAICRFREAGNRFGIVTGRDLEAGLWCGRDLGVPIDFILCCTGGVIVSGNGEILDATEADASFVKELMPYLKAHGARFFNVTYGLVRYMTDPMGVLPYDPTVLPKFHHCNTYFASDEECDAFCALVNETYGDVVHAFRNGNCIDLPPAGVSKPSGIARYLSLIGGQHEVYTVGDNDNDIPMLEAYTGFAVSNANERVKAAAKFQCDRVADMIDTLLQ